jgi:hypothetical protein
VGATATRQAEIVSRQPPRPLRERLSALIKEARERARRRRRRIAAAVIVLSTAAAILVFGGFFNTGSLSHHRSTEPGTVLVAKRLILKGTSGSSIAAQNLFVVRTVPKVQMAPTAISDPAVLQGRVSAADIYPNEQLATSSFTTPH